MKKVSVKYKVFTVLLLLFVFGGCGVKGNPVSISRAGSAERVSHELKAMADEKTVELQINYHHADTLTNYITVERSELGKTGNLCKDCPLSYERIGEISPKENIQGNPQYRYFDSHVTKGKTYRYRVLFCRDAQNCSESNIVEIKFQ